MVKEIQDMRVHLYPSHKFEVSAFSLSETQILGMPAVIRPLGAAVEKIFNGKTGFIANDEAQFVEYSTRILSDLSSFNKMYEESKIMHKVRSWDKVAEEFLQVFKFR
jgi:glycosyltransferase involved in cell wall biosynthesis